MDLAFAMYRNLHRLIALCLALVWGPVTMCCALEAAGLEALCSDATCHESDSEKASPGGCGVVEDGNYNSAVSVVKVAPPITTACVCLISVKDFAPQ